jgi:hypothetical protein
MQRRWGKPSGRLQAASVQTVVATVGRLDALSQNGDLDQLLRSGARFTESAILLSAVAKGETTTIDTKRIGRPSRMRKVRRFEWGSAGLPGSRSNYCANRVGRGLYQHHRNDLHSRTVDFTRQKRGLYQRPVWFQDV